MPKRLDLGGRCDPEVTPQGVPAGFVLGPRGAQFAAGKMQADQGGMDIFLQRIEGERLLRDPDCAVRLARCRALADQCLETGEVETAQALPFEEEGGVAIFAVKIDLRQIVATVEFRRPLQRLGCAGPDQVPEDDRVNLDGAQVQPDGRPVGDHRQRIQIAEIPPQRPERLPQARQCLRLAAVRPEKFGEAPAVLGLPGRHGDPGQQKRCLRADGDRWESRGRTDLAAAQKLYGNAFQTRSICQREGIALVTLPSISIFL